MVWPMIHTEAWAMESPQRPPPDHHEKNETVSSMTKRSLLRRISCLCKRVSRGTINDIDPVTAAKCLHASLEWLLLTAFGDSRAADQLIGGQGAALRFSRDTGHDQTASQLPLAGLRELFYDGESGVGHGPGWQTLGDTRRQQGGRSLAVSRSPGIGFQPVFCLCDECLWKLPQPYRNAPRLGACSIRSNASPKSSSA